MKMPREPSEMKITEELQLLIKDGQIDIGEPVVPRTIKSVKIIDNKKTKGRLVKEQ